LPSGEYNIRSNIRGCQLADERPIEHQLKKGQREHSEKMLRLSAGSEVRTERETTN
jgi:hypothetical protein